MSASLTSSKVVLNDSTSSCGRWDINPIVSNRIALDPDYNLISLAVVFRV